MKSTVYHTSEKNDPTAKIIINTIRSCDLSVVCHVTHIWPQYLPGPGFARNTTTTGNMTRLAKFTAWQTIKFRSVIRFCGALCVWRERERERSDSAVACKSFSELICLLPWRPLLYGFIPGHTKGKGYHHSFSPSLSPPHITSCTHHHTHLDHQLLKVQSEKREHPASWKKQRWMEVSVH